MFVYYQIILVNTRNFALVSGHTKSCVPVYVLNDTVYFTTSAIAGKIRVNIKKY